VADNLYWLGRYVERAEVNVRLLRVLFNRVADKSLLAEVGELPVLMRAFLCLRGGESPAGMDLPPAPTAPPSQGQTQSQSAHTSPLGDEMRVILTESRKPGGIFDTLRLLYYVARVVRDRISSDTWRVLSSLKEDAAWPERLDKCGTAELIEHLNGLLMDVASFGGLASESMTRGSFWRFMDMGRRIERAQSMSTLLRATLAAPRKGFDESALLESILDISDSSMTYRRRYMANLQFAPVLDLLLADETNPRSVAYQFCALEDHVDNLPRDKSMAHLSPEQRIVVSALSAVRLTEIESLCNVGTDGRRGNLEKILLRVDEEMKAFSDVVTRGFLSHAQTSRQLASFRSEGNR
jgi:uncharacterized alpha-E superfamily protein